MIKTITIEGSRIHDIPTFYEEINRIFMEGEDWKLGNSLDALSDLLYGGYGALKGDEPVELMWNAFEKNREDLGRDLTRTYYLEKLNRPAVFNADWAKGRLEELERGTGQTYFEIILEIIAEHGNIRLIPR
ncbi:MAG: ribonuclease inhibitor [Leadbetterella sp.]|nr:ribonuclease inhibitor [Leadbetterella sp.]